MSVLMALALLYYGVYLYRRRSRLALQPVILRQMVVSISILLLFAFAGYCRMLMSWQSSHCEVGAEHQTITAVVIGNPTRYEGKMRFEAVALSGTLRGEHIQTWVYDGHSSSSSFPLPLLRNGMAFTMKAKVRSVDDESSYSHYLISHGIKAVCTTNIHNMSVANIDKPMSADTFKSLIPFFDRLKIASYNLRQRLLSHLGNIGLRGDHSGIVTAMLLGERSSLSDATISHFRHSGASHVLALSGLHLGIIYMLLQFVTLSRRKRLVTEIVT
ncbi:MAG: ComEC/Rec2 family competence protein, partial [Prevotellaceae bacterium]|nr:ComEC/Rec2 family competence protein [Prevotellaceae bacterium]